MYPPFRSRFAEIDDDAATDSDPESDSPRLLLRLCSVWLLVIVIVGPVPEEMTASSFGPGNTSPAQFAAIPKSVPVPAGPPSQVTTARRRRPSNCSTAARHNSPRLTQSRVFRERVVPRASRRADMRSFELRFIGSSPRDSEQRGRLSCDLCKLGRKTHLTLKQATL